MYNEKKKNLFMQFLKVIENIVPKNHNYVQLKKYFYTIFKNNLKYCFKSNVLKTYITRRKLFKKITKTANVLQEM